MDIQSYRYTDLLNSEGLISKSDIISEVTRRATLFDSIDMAIAAVYSIAHTTGCECQDIVHYIKDKELTNASILTYDYMLQCGL